MADYNRTDTGQDQGKAVEEAIREAEAAAAADKAHADDEAEAVKADAVKEPQTDKEHADDEAEAVKADAVKDLQGDKSHADDAAESIQDKAPEAEEKKGFFSKKKDKEKEALKEQVADLDDKLRRQMAEFENFRKRTDKEKEQMFSMGEKNVLEKFLPIIDNFERGFATVTEAQQDDAFVTGMRKVYDQLMKEMGSIGVTAIDAVGQDFDPEFHNAVMQVESEELESGKVAQDFQKGYLYHDTVLRHSMVSVVK